MEDPKVTQYLYLEEGEGRGASQTAILNHVLIGQVIKPFHRQVSGVRVLR